LSDQDRRATEAEVLKSLDKAFKFAIEPGFPVRIEALSISPYPLERGGRVQFIDMSVRYVIVRGRIAYPFTGDLMHEEWLLPASTPGPIAMVREQGLDLFADKGCAFSWWTQSVQAAYRADSNPTRFARGLHTYVGQARQLIDQIETGNYPRRPGDHCAHCPVLDECLGVDP
jgi:hypothetical protein